MILPVNNFQTTNFYAKKANFKPNTKHANNKPKETLKTKFDNMDEETKELLFKCLDAFMLLLASVALLGLLLSPVIKICRLFKNF